VINDFLSGSMPGNLWLPAYLADDKIEISLSVTSRIFNHNQYLKGKKDEKTVLLYFVCNASFGGWNCPCCHVF